MKPKTIKELKKIMIENCYNNALYSIDGNFIYEGCGVDKSGELYIWFYTERGNRENLKYFRTEEEVAAYAFDIISNDKHAKSHLIAMTQNPDYSKEVISKLELRGLQYWFDEIPQFNENSLIRIFVLGCDINKAQDLITYKGF